MSKSVTYDCTIQGEGSMSAIPVPFDPTEAFGKVRAPVIVSIGNFSFRSTISKMNGETWVPLRKSNREAAGVEQGQSIEVTLTLDEAERTVDVPDDLRAALAAVPGAQSAWDNVSYTHRREYVEAIEGAKKPETRVKRVALALKFIKGRLTKA